MKPGNKKVKISNKKIEGRMVSERKILEDELSSIKVDIKSMKTMSGGVLSTASQYRIWSRVGDTCSIAVVLEVAK